MFTGCPDPAGAAAPRSATAPLPAAGVSRGVHALRVVWPYHVDEQIDLAQQQVVLLLQLLVLALQFLGALGSLRCIASCVMCDDVMSARTAGGCPVAVGEVQLGIAEGDLERLLGLLATAGQAGVGAARRDDLGCLLEEQIK